MTHICTIKFANIASDNGLSPVRHQVIWPDPGILLIGRWEQFFLKGFNQNSAIFTDSRIKTATALTEQHNNTDVGYPAMTAMYSYFYDF